MSRIEGYVLGLDVGQTSTKAILAHLDGTRAYSHIGGPVDHMGQSGAQERNAAVIRETIEALQGVASLQPHEVTQVVVGWTAARPNTPEIGLIEGIVGENLPQARVTVLPDYVVSLAGASGGSNGIVVIAGGGSIAYGTAPDGRDAVVGGLGYLLGDEGSAYDIGRRAIAAAARSSDGRDRKTALEGLIREEFALEQVRDITRLVYVQGFARSRIANLAPLVAELALAGDTVAEAIMTDAGVELGRGAVAVAAKLNLCAPAVYTSGGVFKAGELILQPFRMTVQEALPQATICAPAGPPVVGALLLARRAAGFGDDPIWLETVEACLPPNSIR